MTVSNFNIRKLDTTMKDWDIPDGFRQPIINYLIYGFRPGSFFESFLCDDAFGLISHSHPVNRISDLKGLANFFYNSGLRGIAFGDYSSYNAWLRLSDEERIAHLIRVRLIYSEKEEVAAILLDSTN